MPTADEIRQRLAEINARNNVNPASQSMRERIAQLDARTQAQLSPNPASIEGRERIAQANQRTLSDVRNPASIEGRERIAQADARTRADMRARRGSPLPPSGTSRTAPGVTSIDRSGGVTQLNPQGDAPRATASRAGGLGERVRSGTSGVLRRSVNTPTTRALGFLGRGTGRLVSLVGRAATGPLAAITTAATAGDAFSNTELGERVRQPVTDAVARLTGLDDLQNRLLSDDPVVSREAQAQVPEQEPSGISRFFGAGNNAVAENTSVGTLSPLPSQTPRPGEVPENSIVTEDGSVLRVNPDAQVNTISAENFVRPVSPDGGRSLAAALARGDFEAAEFATGTPEERAAITAQRRTRQNELDQFNEGERVAQELAQATRRLGISPSRTERAALRERIAQLRGDQTTVQGRNTAVTVPEDPNNSPSVIAERLRQEGLDRRPRNSAPDLLQGFEPIEGVSGETQGFRGATRDGRPVELSTEEATILSQDFSRVLQLGILPPGVTFVDYVSLPPEQREQIMQAAQQAGA